jgi:NAD(P) transhydrogenase subunit alpha
MKIGVLKETYPGEQRVALVPAVLPSLIKGGMEVVIESQAGELSGYTDAAYVEKGGTIAESRAQVFEVSDFILQVRLLGANPNEGKADLKSFRQGQKLVGMAEALGNPQSVQELATLGV